MAASASTASVAKIVGRSSYRLRCASEPNIS
jgi:hypothetical protein